jgi:TolB-like protein/tetratricopeptide (TPR) repeat protein
MKVLGSGSVLRFGCFELEQEIGELRRDGTKIRLQEQPLQILTILLDNPGKIVARDELRKKIWPSDTFVDFDHGINNAIKRLREALGDPAESPKFIETIPRRGYRFVGTLQTAQVSSEPNGCIDSIAVFPLFNAASDPDTDYLSAGIPGSVIQSLSRIAGLRVIAWGMLADLKNVGFDPLAIGRKLRVKAVLTGRICVRSSRLRLQIDLIDTVTGQELWGDQYDRDLTELFKVQDEVSTEVSHTLRLKLSGEDQTRVTRRYTDDIEAYRLYVRGRRYGEVRSVEGFKKAVECLQQAVRRDPGYALAYAELAQVLHTPAYYASVSPHEAYPKAREIALKALAMDQTIAEAHDALATTMQNYDRDWIGSEKEYQRSIELNPNYPVGRFHYAMHLAMRGRFEEAVSQAREGQIRDPVSGIMNAGLAWILVTAREFDWCIEQSHTAIDVDPTVTLSYVALGTAYEQKQMYAEAISSYQEGISLGGAVALSKAFLGHVHGSAGDRDRAREILAELEDMSRRAYMPALNRAIIYDGLKEADRGIEALEQSLRDRDTLILSIKVWPQFDYLRTDPRFAVIERRLGLRS